MVTGYRSEYLKSRSALFALREKENICLKIVSIGAHNLDRFGQTSKDILKDGFKIDYYVYNNVEGNCLDAMAQSISSGISQLTCILNKENPDIVLICADRYEMFSASISACMSGFVVAHIEGGEISGCLDESIRHAMTKLSHIHFPATEISKRRIIQMGEDKKNVFNVGCCFYDYMKSLTLDLNSRHFRENNFPFLPEKYGIIIQHSVTTEYKKSYQQMKITLSALQKYGLECILIWPNSDSGSEEISRAIREHNKKYGDKSIIKDAWRTMGTNLFMNLLYHSACIIGNSSSGIREAYTYGIVAINIGSRQQGRERTKNVIDVNHDEKEIYEALEKYSGKKIYDNNNLYGNGTAGKQIANILETINLDGILNKRFCD